MQQREIKFRIYHKGRKAWLHDTEHAISLFGETIMFGEVWKMPDDSGIPISEMNECIAMQFTGLKDAKGVEIYEGDIVKYQDYNTTDKIWKVANVYWMDWADWSHVPFLHPFGSPVAGKNEEDGRSIETVYVTPPNACEVIGNIYEHLELLK